MVLLSNLIPGEKTFLMVSIPSFEITGNGILVVKLTTQSSLKNEGPILCGLLKHKREKWLWFILRTIPLLHIPCWKNHPLSVYPLHQLIYIAVYIFISQQYHEEGGLYGVTMI